MNNLLRLGFPTYNIVAFIKITIIFVNNSKIILKPLKLKILIEFFGAFFLYKLVI